MMNNFQQLLSARTLAVSEKMYKLIWIISLKRLECKTLFLNESWTTTWNYRAVTSKCWKIGFSENVKTSWVQQLSHFLLKSFHFAQFHPSSERVISRADASLVAPWHQTWSHACLPSFEWKPHRAGRRRSKQVWREKADNRSFSESSV